MVNKKAYLKTLEAVIAIIIFLIFITYILIFNVPSGEPSIPQDIELLQDSILNNIQTNHTLRSCLVVNDDICIKNSIDPQIPTTIIGYHIQICNSNSTISDPSDCPPVKINFLPDDVKIIYSDSLMIQEQDEFAILRLFLWRKLE